MDNDISTQRPEPDYNKLISGLVQENAQLRWEIAVAHDLIQQYESRLDAPKAE